MPILGLRRLAASDLAASAEAIARSGKPAVALRGVGKRYGTGAAAVNALAGVDLEVWPGEFGPRVRAWRWHLAALAGQTGLTVTVCHFPPGTSKWNKIEHRRFSFISMNWRGRPLTDIRTVVEVIAATTTKTGLTVQCAYDPNWYPTGERISDADHAAIPLRRHDWHGRLELRHQCVNRSINPAADPKHRRRQARYRPRVAVSGVEGGGQVLADDIRTISMSVTSPGCEVRLLTRAGDRWRARTLGNGRLTPPRR